MPHVIYKNRKKTNSRKWDCQFQMFGEENLHAMWIADMDFQTPTCVSNAIVDYVKNGVLGYYGIPESYYNSFINWQKSYHSSNVQREWIRFSPGVVPAINWIIQFMTKRFEPVIVLTPVYYPFLEAVKNNERKLITCDLIDSNGYYTIDFNDFEKKIVEHDVKIFILCSPHNPVGRVWNHNELNILLSICKKHNVFVISDEIHQDFTFSDNIHIPSANVGDFSDMLITLTAATKTFNLAGCQNSFVIIPNELIRERYDEFTTQIRIFSGNLLGYIAVEAAYTNGRAWFEEVKRIIYENYQYVKNSFSEYLPHVVVSPLEGTYLLWLNFEYYLLPSEVKKFMQHECKLAFDYGDWFGSNNFGACVRMNLATSKESVDIAVQQIIKNIMKIDFSKVNCSEKY